MVSRPVLQFAVSGLLALVVVGIGAFFVLRSQGDSESVLFVGGSGGLLELDAAIG